MKITSGFVALTVIVFVFSTCKNRVAETANSLSPRPSLVAPSTPDLNPTPLASEYGSVRQIDFENFTYFWTKEQGEGENFTLKSGKLEMVGDESGANLGKIEYGDVTNDKKDEAFIRISPETGGNCQCEMVFVYTVENKRPKLLWSFDTGDRAEGGLKKVYAHKSELVVETFGDNKFENDKWEFGFAKKVVGYCCPTAFTKMHFIWSGEKFVEKGNREILDYDWKNPSNKN